MGRRARAAFGQSEARLSANRERLQSTCDVTMQPVTDDLTR